jgi:hypothetical protein
MHVALRRKNKDWLARNHDNVSRVDRHVYPRTVVSVSGHFKNLTKHVGVVPNGLRIYAIDMEFAPAIIY